jgi:hypothetical protein
VTALIPFGGRPEPHIDRYRLLDTALLYGNQEAVGAGLRKSGVPRDHVWITSKVAFFPSDSEGCWMWDAKNVKGDEAVGRHFFSFHYFVNLVG